MSAKEGYKNKLYYPHTSNYNETDGYWLASPSASRYGNYVLYVAYNGSVDYINYRYDYNDYGSGLRPVVSLKSGVSVTTTDEE